MSKLKAVFRAQVQSAGIRTEELEGQTFYVVPLVMLLEGVHCPQGPGPTCLLHPAAEIAASAPLWDNVPVVIRHPYDSDGNPSTARTPQVLNQQGVGRIFNTHYDGDTTKLHAEAWLDLQRVQELSQEAAAAITGGQQMDVSNGMYVNYRIEAGTWNGEDYDGVAVDYTPDHLALLPGEVGACSWADGCGVRASEGAHKMTMRFSIAEGSPVDKALLWMTRTYNTIFKAGAVSHEELRQKIQKMLDGMDAGGWMHFAREIFDTELVYVARTTNPSESSPERMYKQRYRVKDNGDVELTGNPVAVEEERRYVPVASAAGGSSCADDGKGLDMGKTEQVAALIAHKGTRFADDDKDWLTALTECQLKKLEVAEEATPAAPPAAAPAAAPEPAPAAAPEPKPEPAPTASAAKPFDISQLPPEMRESVERAMERDAADKAELVKAIMANTSNPFTEDELKAKNLKELGALAKLARVAVDHSAQGGAPRVSEDKDAPPAPKPVWDLTKKTEPAAA